MTYEEFVGLVETVKNGSLSERMATLLLHANSNANTENPDFFLTMKDSQEKKHKLRVEMKDIFFNKDDKQGHSQTFSAKALYENDVNAPTITADFMQKCFTVTEEISKNYYDEKPRLTFWVTLDGKYGEVYDLSPAMPNQSKKGSKKASKKTFKKGLGGAELFSLEDNFKKLLGVNINYLQDFSYFPKYSESLETKKSEKKLVLYKQIIDIRVLRTIAYGETLYKNKKRGYELKECKNAQSGWNSRVHLTQDPVEYQEAVERLQKLTLAQMQLFLPVDELKCLNQLIMNSKFKSNNLEQVTLQDLVKFIYDNNENRQIADEETAALWMKNLDKILKLTEYHNHLMILDAAEGELQSLEKVHIGMTLEESTPVPSNSMQVDQESKNGYNNFLKDIQRITFPRMFFKKFAPEDKKESKPNSFGMSNNN